MTRSTRPSGARHAVACGFIAGSLLLAGCGAPPPDDLGPTADGLRPCPHVPNCVHTGDEHPEEVEPFLLTGAWLERPAEDVWAAVASAAAALPGTVIVERTETYIHAEATTAVFRFIDDLEIYRAPEEPEIIVRSESRVGRSDMGVNMRRVEALRQALQEAGVIR